LSEWVGDIETQKMVVIILVLYIYDVSKPWIHTTVFNHLLKPLLPFWLLLTHFSIRLFFKMVHTQRNVEFPTVDGTTLRGLFFSPVRDGTMPCIVMTHGFSGLKEQFLPDFAERFCTAGYAVLIYDHRSWGSSGGFPRNETDPTRQALDYSDAFDFVTSLPEVDPTKIVFWGSSMGGGIVILAAAFEKRIAAVIVQVPFVSGESVGPVIQAYLPAIYADRLRIKSGHPPEMTKVIAESPESAKRGDSGALMGKPDVAPYLEELTRRGQSWEKDVTLQSVFNISVFEPRAFIHRISPTPLLMVVAERDATVSTSSQLEAFASAREPKTLAVIKNSEHFDLYFGNEFEDNISAQLDFLGKVCN
ncbi:kda protein in trax-fino intergenic region, partial [Colletotrichum incanum]